MSDTPKHGGLVKLSAYETAMQKIAQLERENAELREILRKIDDNWALFKLERENAELRVDAERYRFIREFNEESQAALFSEGEMPWGEALDEVIDAALKKAKS